LLTPRQAEVVKFAQRGLTAKEIARQLGITVIFTEHDMQVVFAVADIISVLHQGKVLVEGKPERIRDDPDVQKIYLGEQGGIAAAAARAEKKTATVA